MLVVAKSKQTNGKLFLSVLGKSKTFKNAYIKRQIAPALFPVAL